MIKPTSTKKSFQTMWSIIIRVGQDDKGVITFNISEDGIQDTVKFDKNGDIYVNGNKVVISPRMVLIQSKLLFHKHQQ